MSPNKAIDPSRYRVITNECYQNPAGSSLALGRQFYGSYKFDNTNFNSGNLCYILSPVIYFNN